MMTKIFNRMVRTAYLTLLGLFSFIVVCPITMGAMPMDMNMDMDMGGMTAMSDMVQSDNEESGEMPCEQCTKEKEEIVASFATQTEVMEFVGSPVAFLAFWEIAEPYTFATQRMPLLTNSPPISTDTLVGTVILQI